MEEGFGPDVLTKSRRCSWIAAVRLMTATSPTSTYAARNTNVGLPSNGENQICATKGPVVDLPAFRAGPFYLTTLFCGNLRITGQVRQFFTFDKEHIGQCKQVDQDHNCANPLDLQPLALEQQRQHKQADRIGQDV